MPLILNLDWNDFLQNYWQKKPLLIKNAFEQFKDPITPEILAGLAMEAEIDSRIVTNPKNQWNFASGPFEDFSLLTDTHSTLLVQAVNHWYNPVKELLTPFEVLPRWRLDDLMISYSTPKGGVGPHVDQYDVFILQGMGTRHWKVGEIQPVKSCTPHPRLLQVESFIPTIDEILEPGDLLYIPPLAPHEGYAITPALNYSIGFRSPSATELLSGFADHVIDNKLGTGRYYDIQAFTHLSELKSESPLTIRVQEKNALKQMLLDLIEDESHFNSFLGGFLSQSRHELDLIEDETLDSLEIVKTRLAHGETIIPLLGLKIIEIDSIIYIQGQAFTIPDGAFKTWLCSGESLTLDTYESLALSPEINALFLNLLQSGFWHFEADESDDSFYEEDEF